MPRNVCSWTAGMRIHEHGAREQLAAHRSPLCATQHPCRAVASALDKVIPALHMYRPAAREHVRSDDQVRRRFVVFRACDSRVLCACGVDEPAMHEWDARVSEEVELRRGPGGRRVREYRSEAHASVVHALFSSGVCGNRGWYGLVRRDTPESVVEMSTSGAECSRWPATRCKR
jgi:hypothetical protein